MTNADKVRAMSDDDLAILLARPCSNPNAATECLSSHFNPLKCIVCWLKWLEKEAEND